MVKTENLYDEIEIIFDEKKYGIKIFCDDKSIPTDEKNICWKIAEKFFEVAKKKVGISIKIKKRIPALAGLGGGSSNGASVLLALNDYFENSLNFNKLVTLAAQVGKDIPFFLHKENCAYVSGAGEKLKPIANFPKLNFLLINPKGEIGTGWAYGELDRRMWFMEDKKRKNISQIFLKNSSDVERMYNWLYNDFEIVAEEKFPIIKEIKNGLISFGALGASITGKGPTVFGIFKTKKEALKVKEILKKKYPEFFVEIG
jgi:4-diphosphocytidyl-2-C-methyl-D-erythritol kinase